MTIKNFEELEVWQEARKLNKIIYAIVDQPRVSYRLKEQITAAALSIMTNIAEGFESQSNPEFIRFLIYARRSVAEVQSALYVVFDQGFVTQEKFQKIYDQARSTFKLANGLIRYLKSCKKFFS